MAWAPKYGLKGMIDASVRVKVQSNPHEAIEKIVPVEFKTGKATSGQASLQYWHGERDVSMIGSLNEVLCST